MDIYSGSLVEKYRFVSPLIAKFKMDWQHYPLPAIPPCPYQKGYEATHNGKPARPEHRYYYLYFLTVEDAMHCAELLQVPQMYPDYRIYPLIR